MESMMQSTANQAKLVRVNAAWKTVLGETLTRGFYGQGLVEITVQDGTIQVIRRSVERIDG
jgi:hypothetical protein